MDNGGVARINASRTQHSAISDAITIFEEEMKISFKQNFSYAFNISLTRVFEEMDTRRTAIELAKTCIQRLAGNEPLAVYYTLPFVAFGQEDPQWVLNVTSSSCQTIGEFIFKDFDARKPDDRQDIVGYLAQMLGERHCAHRIELLADCLIFGSKTYPQLLAPFKKFMLEKCWKMLAAESNQTKIEKLAMLCASFCVMPWAKSTNVKIKIGRFNAGDDTLGVLIGNTIDSIAVLARTAA
jgi:hypothetical protein